MTSGRYYIARQEEGQWLLSYPPLFAIKSGSILTLQALRDIQFSFVCADGDTTKLYLIQSTLPWSKVSQGLQDVCVYDVCTLSPYQIHNSEEDVRIIKVYDYVCDKNRPEQNGLFMDYYWSEGEKLYYVTLPRITLIRN